MASSTKKFLRKLVPFPTRKTLLRWFPPRTTRRMVHLMQAQGIDVVLDVGANMGQFATKLRSAGYAGRIVSFEPLSGPHNDLVRAAAADPRWEVAPRMAVGDHAGEVTLNVFGDHTLSSCRPMADATTDDPARQVVARETAVLAPLDDLFDQWVRPGETVLLKLDVQGLEPEVFAGAKGCLDRVHGVEIELSLLPIYTGETHYLEMLQWLENRGFYVFCFVPVLNRIRMVREEQIDALLFREPERDVSVAN